MESSYSKEDIFVFVKESLLNCEWIFEGDVELKSRIYHDLILDDCDFSDLVEDIQTEYQIYISEDTSDSWMTVEDIVDSVYSLLNE